MEPLKTGLYGLSSFPFAIGLGYLVVWKFDKKHWRTLRTVSNKFQRHQDQQGFTEIVKACQADLRNYCRRLTAGDNSLADDIAQESLIIAYQQLGQLNNMTDPNAATKQIEQEQVLVSLMRFLSEQQRAVITLCNWYYIPP